MSRIIFITLMFFALVLYAEEKILVDGVEAGKFTMDLDAAQKYAKKNNQIILLNFTGSDWCHWCKLMEKNVFDKSAWSEYAKDNVVMVWLDYPKDKSIVPRKYVTRNNVLREKYKISGYPTYILLDSTGHEMTRLGAGKGKNPTSFAKEVEVALEMTEARVEAFSKKLGGQAGVDYKNLQTELKQLKKEKKAAEQKIKESGPRIAIIEEKLEVTRVKSRLSKEQQVEYEKARVVFANAQKTLQQFISSRPPSSVENRAKYQKLYDALSKAKKEMNSF